MRMKWENLHTLLSNDTSISSNFSVNISYKGNWASLISQWVKKLPSVQETWVLPLGQEDPLEKEVADHSSMLAWKILLFTERSLAVCNPAVHKESSTIERLTHTHIKVNYMYPGATCPDESPTLSFTSWNNPAQAITPRSFSLVKCNSINFIKFLWH